jgi:response regulator RpfG family c-di-GMP phosphodiesterase
LNHHEKWDGSGYPGHINIADGQVLPGHAKADGSAQGKQGEEIPLFGRIVAIADVYDALSFHRSYKESWDETKVLETIKSGSGAHFDPELVAAFFNSIDNIRAISARYPENKSNNE